MKKFFLLSGIALFIVGFFLFRTTAAEDPVDTQTVATAGQTVVKKMPRPDKPEATVEFSQQNPASLKPVLRWTKVESAVAYEIELFQENPGVYDEPRFQPAPFFSTSYIYVNGYNADLTDRLQQDYFYWRVHGLNLDGQRIGDDSDVQKVYVDQDKDIQLKPIPTSVFNQTAGSVLLYPVYAWIPVAGGDKYEVEILDDLPENPNGIEPSVHRIDSAIAVGFDYYDPTPRVSRKPFYWRVRAMDQEGNPVGVYSDVGKFGVVPSAAFEVATYGDSITHGGGAVSYSPSDWEYSYQHYLDFPVINLGKSGDTSATMVERFEQDVLPFKPRYLIIMGGSNSMRGGYSAEDIIADLTALKKKCLANGIHPVFLTLPPINPGNIKRVFDEPTAAGWQQERQKINDFIRTQDYIDVAQGMESPEGLLPNELATDGLHLDIKGKQMIAAAINANWGRITGPAIPGK